MALRPPGTVIAVPGPVARVRGEVGQRAKGGRGRGERGVSGRFRAGRKRLICPLLNFYQAEGENTLSALSQRYANKPDRLCRQSAPFGKILYEPLNYATNSIL